MLDWRKPGKAIIVTVCAILFVLVVHFLCFLLYRARVWLFTKLCIRSHKRYGGDGELGDDFAYDSCARLGGGSSADYSHQQQYPTVNSQQPRRSQHTVSTHTGSRLLASTDHCYDNIGHGIHHQYPPQYSGYQQQPVVAGVNVGVISTAEIYEQDNNNANKQHQHQHQHQLNGDGVVGVVGAGNHPSSLSHTVAHLSAAQRQEYLNFNKIMEYKM